MKADRIEPYSCRLFVLSEAHGDVVHAEAGLTAGQPRAKILRPRCGGFQGAPNRA